MAQRVHLAQASPPGRSIHGPHAPSFHRPRRRIARRLAAACLRDPRFADEYSRELIPALERVVESTKRRRRILNLVQDALSQLRLDMKYLMFDVEATRRERDEYHARLQELES